MQLNQITTNNDAPNAVACPVVGGMQPELVETRLLANGRTGFRIRGIAMAWCNSALEALRVAHILIRAGYAGPVNQLPQG